MERDYASPKRVLEARGLRPRKRFGQNFLVDARLAQRIAALLPEDASVLEIGGGTGTLTAALADTARSLDVIEVDRGLVEVLRERFAEQSERVRITGADVLDLDLHALLAEERMPRAICANLPYNITTPLLERIVAAADLWQCAVLMVQHEYARRLAARPGTPDYGSLTVFVNYFCDVERCFDAGAAAFYPAPQVSSSVIRLRPKARSTLDASEQALFLWLVRAAFAQRRKTLVNSVAGALEAAEKEAARMRPELRSGPTKDAARSQRPELRSGTTTVDARRKSPELRSGPTNVERRTTLESALCDVGLAPGIRAERLSLTDFIALTQRLHAQGFRTPVR